MESHHLSQNSPKSHITTSLLFFHVLLNLTSLLVRAAPTTVSNSTITVDYTGNLTNGQIDSFRQCLNDNGGPRVALEIMGYSGDSPLYVAWSAAPSPDNVTSDIDVIRLVESCFRLMNITASVQVRPHGAYAVTGAWETEAELANHFSYFGTPYPTDFDISLLDDDSMTSYSEASSTSLTERGNWPDTINHWTTWRSSILLVWYAAKKLSVDN